MENTSTLSIFSVATLFFLIFLTNADPYEYLLHVQHWQPAVCSNPRHRCVFSPQQRFSVHGVWHGNISNGKPVINCAGGSAFDPRQINPIINDLFIDWPDVIRTNHNWFWQHEWDVHGRCSESVFNQLAYFSLGRQKLRAFDILTILSNAGFVPFNQQVNATLVAAAITSAIGRTPALRCSEIRGRPRNLRQLAEVVLCFDQTGQTLIDCPVSVHQCPTGATVLFST
ncbi:hypothetical protein SLE2022_278340 [Rubroshorea leprosula]